MVENFNQNRGPGPVHVKVSHGSRAETGSCRDFVHSL